MNQARDHVIIAGYGVGGRFIAEHLRALGMPFVIVEMNAQTCSTQRELGIDALEGDISNEETLRRAGIESASVLALAIPDERAAVRATEIAHAIRPDIHIIAATRYTSTGLQALRNGADEVIVAEQAVAHEFYRRIDRFMRGRGRGCEQASASPADSATTA